MNIITSPVLSPAGNLGVTLTGAFNLSFPGFSNATYSVWGSTNLVNWALLGPAAQLVPGEFQFTDAGASNQPARYYRLSSP